MRTQIILVSLGAFLLLMGGGDRAWADETEPGKAAELRAAYEKIDERLFDIAAEVRAMNISPDDLPRERQKMELRRHVDEVQKLIAELAALDAELAALSGSSRSAGSLTMEFVDDAGAPLRSVKRNQRVIARIPASELASAGEIGVINWTVTTPGGRQVHPRGEKSGESGLRMSMRPGDTASIGEFQVKAEVNTETGILLGEGSFSLVEGDITPTPTPGGEAALTASIHNPITGRPAMVVMPELPFEIEDPSLVTVEGVGEWADGFFKFDPGGRRIQFRGKKEGPQTPQFRFTYGEREVMVQCPTDVAISIVRTEIYWLATDMRRLEIPIILIVPDYFEPSFTARSTPNRAFDIYPDQLREVSGARELKGAIRFEWLEPRRRMELRVTDATGAEFIADLDFPVEQIDFRVPPDYKLGDEMELELPGWPRIERAIGGASLDRLVFSNNIVPEQVGTRLRFLIVTKPDDEPHQPLLLVAVGDGGVAKGQDDFNVESCVCCDPPADVVSALRGFKDPWALLANFNSAVRSKDEERAQRIVDDALKKQLSIYKWWGGLKDCRHLSPKAREFFTDLARVVELSRRGDEASQQQAHDILHKLQRNNLTHSDFEEGFMCDFWEKN